MERWRALRAPPPLSAMMANVVMERGLAVKLHTRGLISRGRRPHATLWFCPPIRLKLTWSASCRNGLARRRSSHDAVLTSFNLQEERCDIIRVSQGQEVKTPLSDVHRKN